VVSICPCYMEIMRTSNARSLSIIHSSLKRSHILLYQNPKRSSIARRCALHQTEQLMRAISSVAWLLLSSWRESAKYHCMTKWMLSLPASLSNPSWRYHNSASKFDPLSTSYSGPSLYPPTTSSQSRLQSTSASNFAHIKNAPLNFRFSE
jgi:hypothetical protein